MRSHVTAILRKQLCLTTIDSRTLWSSCLIKKLQLKLQELSRDNKNIKHKMTQNYNSQFLLGRKPKNERETIDKIQISKTIIRKLQELEVCGSLYAPKHLTTL